MSNSTWSGEEVILVVETEERIHHAICFVYAFVVVHLFHLLAPALFCRNFVCEVGSFSELKNTGLEQIFIIGVMP
jgi:hypothetical protein